MLARTTSDDRDMIIHVMESESGERVRYTGLPEFSYTAGGLTLLRDGCIEYDEDDSSAGKTLAVLAGLGLCDHPYEPKVPGEGVISCRIEDEGASALINLISIVSARQRLLCQAIDARGAFYVSESLMRDLLAHLPETADGFLRRIYGREDEHRGLGFNRAWVSMPGFACGHREETHIHRQIADLMWEAACSRQWVKPFTPNVRNRKYAMRTWLSSIGMTGSEYDEARRVLLGRLAGRTDRRSMPRRREV